MLIKPICDPVAGWQTAITMLVGETVNMAVQLFQADGVTPLNITGYSFKAQIGFPTPYAMNTGNGGIVITGASTGQIALKIPSNGGSANFEHGSFPWDLWSVDTLGAELPLMSGPWKVLNNVSPVP